MLRSVPNNRPNYLQISSYLVVPRHQDGSQQTVAHGTNPTCELRMVSTLLSSLKKKEGDFVTLYEIQISVLINKPYWNTAMFIHFHAVYNCFSTRVAELNCCNRDSVAHKSQRRLLSLVLQRKSLLTLALGDREAFFLDPFSWWYRALENLLSGQLCTARTQQSRG